MALVGLQLRAAVCSSLSSLSWSRLTVRNYSAKKTGKPGWKGAPWASSVVGCGAPRKILAPFPADRDPFSPPVCGFPKVLLFLCLFSVDCSSAWRFHCCCHPSLSQGKRHWISLKATCLPLLQFSVSQPLFILRCVDYNPQNSPASILAEEFWVLKSIPLKVTEVEKTRYRLPDLPLATARNCLLVVLFYLSFTYFMYTTLVEVQAIH